MAFLLSAFPTLSETFISSQIIGLLRRGVEVDIHASPSHATHVHPSIYENDLLGRTFYRFDDAATPLRRLTAAGAVLVRGWRHPELISALNPRRYGREALSLRLLFATRQLLDRRGYDVIHCHYGPVGLLGVQLKRVLNLPAKVVTTFHGYDLSRYVRRHGASVYKPLFDRGDLLLAISDGFRRELVGLGCPPEKIRVHHVGVDCSALEFRPRRSTSSPVKLLSIARLTEKKGLEYAIRAVARVEGAGYPIRYRIIGDGPLKKPLQLLIRDLGSSSIELSGWITEDRIAEALYESDILLAPSVTASDGDREGTPVSIMEAMATGVPVVTTRHSGIPEMITDGTSGILVNERNDDALSDRLIYLIENPSQRLFLAQNARGVVENKFDIDRLNDHLAHIYEEIL